MGRKQLKSSEKASDPRRLPRRSPRFKSLAGSSQPQLQAFDQRHLKRYPRFNTLDRVLQRQLKAFDQRHLKRSPRFNTLDRVLQRQLKIPSLKDAGISIISLPPEILTKIFSYLTHNELGQIARVCKTFNEYTRCPTLWKRVDLKFFCFNRFQNDVDSIFTKYIPSSVMHLKLDFAFCLWDGKIYLNFKQLCVNIKEKVKNLHTLILHHVTVLEDFPSVIDLCSEFFPNLKALTFSKAIFGTYCEKKCGISNIKDLTVFQCRISQVFSYTFTKLPYLEKINFTRTCGNHYWFLNDDDAFSLHQLKILHLGNTRNSDEIFCLLKSNAVNLTELSLCYSRLRDVDFRVDKSVFPLLKTICLRCCPFITLNAVVSLAQSCKSLQNIYVDRKRLAELYANHPFVIANVSKLGIVKAVDDCDHFEESDCFFNQ